MLLSSRFREHFSRGSFMTRFRALENPLSTYHVLNSFNSLKYSICPGAIFGGSTSQTPSVGACILWKAQMWVTGLFIWIGLHGWGKVTCLSVKSDLCSFLIWRDIWDGETKSCLCLGPVDPAVSPEESWVQHEGEQVPGGYVRDCPWAPPMAPSHCSFRER